jgi:uncharacterized protein YlxP (DUF503 family)
MNIGLLTLHLHLPGCKSLKEKRRRLKPLLIRLHRLFNISISEIDKLDSWQDSIVACVLVSNDNGHTQRSMNQVVHWIETSWPDISLVSDQFEFL